MNIKLFICSYVLYTEEQDSYTVEKIDAMALTAFDYDEAKEMSERFLDSLDQKYDLVVQELNKETYSTVLLYNFQTKNAEA